MKIGSTEGMLEARKNTAHREKPLPGPDRHVVGRQAQNTRYARISCPLNESALGNLLADALRGTGADRAAINAGTLTAGIGKEITESDLATSMLYGLNNHVVTVRCKGANLISILSTNNLTDAVREDQSSVFGGMVIPSASPIPLPTDRWRICRMGDRWKSAMSACCGERVDPDAWHTGGDHGL
ncbi:MAG: 5'-nucleotidase C-terminal domain-containing protein [Enterocloster bolteae]